MTWSRSTRWRNGNRFLGGGSRRRKLHVLRNRDQMSHRLRNRSLVRPISGRRQRWSGRRGVLPLVHLFSVGQLGSCPTPTTAQASLVGFYLGPQDGQLDLLVINLEDGCQYSTKSVKDCKRHLGAKLIDLNAIGTYPPVHDVFPTRKLHIPLLETNV